MNTQKKITIFFQEDVRNRLGIKQLQESLARDENHDLKLKKINSLYHLQIPFLDRCNFIVDYGYAGHVVLSEVDTYKLLILPSEPDTFQIEHVRNLKIEEEDNFYIYSIENQELAMFEKSQTKNKGNKEMLEEVLASKEGKKQFQKSYPN